MTVKNQLKELDVAQLAERLCEDLKKRSGDISVFDVQTLVVQALGHRDWEAALYHWSPETALRGMENKDQHTEITPSKDNSESLDVKLDQLFEGCLDQLAKTKHLPTLSEVAQLVSKIKRIHKGAQNLKLYTAIYLLENAIRKSETIDSNTLHQFPDLHRVIERWIVRSQNIFYSHFDQEEKKKELPRLSQNYIQDQATLKGDWALLQKAIHEKVGPSGFHQKNHENLPSIKVLCEWWNLNAPLASQHAQCFYVGTVNPEEETVSLLGYEDCPPWSLEDWAEEEYAWFKKEGCPTIVVLFLRGQQYNRRIDHSVHIYKADGNLLWEVGCELHEVDESYYSMLGVQELKALIAGI